MTEFAIRPGSRVAHYRFEEQIGAGGMGEVYRAVDLTLERRVALKILPPSLLNDVERVRRFVQEAKSASALNHPHIVTIYEIGEGMVAAESPAAASEKVHYIAMEYIDGRTLRAMLRDEAPLRELLAVLTQAADGLAKAHGAGIVHRDLKPDNIMVTADGYAKVVDFGLAKLTDEAQQQQGKKGDSMLTARGMVVGTLGYMAPEQIEGKPVRAAADIFAFGCILYECIAGRRPFEGDLAIDTMHRIVFSEPLPLPTVRPGVDPRLTALVDRCLRKRPEERLGSMREVASALRVLVGSDPAIPIAAAETPVVAVAPEPVPVAMPVQPPVADTPTHRAAASSAGVVKRRGLVARSFSMAYRTALVLIIGTAVYVGATMPDVERLAKERPDGVGSWTELEKIPTTTRRALVAAVDPEFYERKRLDFEQPRVMLQGLAADGRGRYLPSPIARRVAAATFPASKLNPLRPAREWVIAVEMQRKLSTRRMLELYANVAPFGETQGIGAAAKKYFDKSPSKLDRNEAAMLSALAVSSDAFDPAAPPAEAVAMKASILERMATVGTR